MQNNKTNNIQEILRSYQGSSVDNSRHKQALEQHLLKSDYFVGKKSWYKNVWAKVSLVSAPIGVAALIIVLLFSSITRPLSAQQVFAKAAESYAEAAADGHILYSKYKITYEGSFVASFDSENVEETWQDINDGDFRKNTYNGEHLADSNAYIDGRSYICTECTPFAPGEEPSPSELAALADPYLPLPVPGDSVMLEDKYGVGGGGEMNSGLEMPEFLGGGSVNVPVANTEAQLALYRLFSPEPIQEPETRSEIFTDLKNADTAEYNGNIEWRGHQVESIKISISDPIFKQYMTTYLFFDENTFWLVGTVDVVDANGYQSITTREILEEYYTDDETHINGDDLFKTSAEFSECGGEPFSEEIYLEERGCEVLYVKNLLLADPEALEKLGPNGDMNLEEYIEWQDSQGVKVQIVE